MNVTLPNGMELMDWADQISLDLDQYGSIGKLQNESEWQDWAIRLLNISAIGKNLPVPYSSDEWREWAERFCQSLA